MVKFLPRSVEQDARMRERRLTGAIKALGLTSAPAMSIVTHNLKQIHGGTQPGGLVAILPKVHCICFRLFFVGRDTSSLAPEGLS